MNIATIKCESSQWGTVYVLRTLACRMVNGMTLGHTIDEARVALAGFNARRAALGLSTFAVK